MVSFSKKYSRTQTDLLCQTVKLTTRHSGYCCLWQNLYFYFLISYSCIFSYDTYVLVYYII